MEFTMTEYLERLGWDVNEWTIIEKEKAKALEDISGYQNYLYDVDRKGAEAFGKGSKIAKLSFVEQHKAKFEQEEKQEAQPEKAPASIPPPPPAPPKKEEVSKQPEEKQEEKKPEPKKEWPNFVKVRVANLIKNGFQMRSTTKLQSTSGRVITYQEIEDMQNDEYTKLISAKPKGEEKSEAVSVPEQKTKEFSIPTARIENLKKKGFEDNPDDQELIAPDEKIVSYEELDAMPAEEWLAFSKSYKKDTSEEDKKERIKKRVEFLKEKGLKLSEDGKELIAPDETFAVDALGDMNNDEWMPLTSRYNKKIITEMEAKKATNLVVDNPEDDAEDNAAIEKYEANKAADDGPRSATEEVKPEENKDEKESKTETVSSETNEEVSDKNEKTEVDNGTSEGNGKEFDVNKHLSENGWDPKSWTVLKKGDWEYLASRKEYSKNVLDQANTKELIEIYGKDARLVSVEFLKQSDSDIRNEGAEPEDLKKLQKEVHEEPAENITRNAIEKGKKEVEKDFIENLKSIEIQTSKSSYPTRDELALKIMFELLPNAGKKNADTIAQYSYDLADAMIKLKK